MGSVCDQTDAGGFGDQLQGLEHRGAACLQLALVVHGGVDEEDVRGGGRDQGSRERVLDRGVGWEQLRGQVAFGDALVVRREVVSGLALGADPDFGVEVHGGVRIQYRPAVFAQNGLVRHHRHVLELFIGRVQRAHWHDALGGSHSGPRPDVPRQPHCILVLQLLETGHRRELRAPSADQKSRGRGDGGRETQGGRDGAAAC